MADTRSRAQTTLDLLLAAEATSDNDFLNIATRLAFPLQPLETVKDTPRFRASYAIEVLVKSILRREPSATVKSRYELAVDATRTWLRSFDH